MITANINRKRLLMLILVVVGYAFIEIGLKVSFLGFLGAIGIYLLIGIVIYDHYRTQKKYEEKYSQH